MPIPEKCTWSRCTYHFRNANNFWTYEKICLPLLTKTLFINTHNIICSPVCVNYLQLLSIGHQFFWMIQPELGNFATDGRRWHHDFSLASRDKSWWHRLSLVVKWLRPRLRCLKLWSGFDPQWEPMFLRGRGVALVRPRDTAVPKVGKASGPFVYPNSVKPILQLIITTLLYRESAPL